MNDYVLFLLNARRHLWTYGYQQKYHVLRLKLKYWSFGAINNSESHPTSRKMRYIPVLLLRFFFERFGGIVRDRLVRSKMNCYIWLKLSSFDCFAHSRPFIHSVRRFHDVPFLGAHLAIIAATCRRFLVIAYILSYTFSTAFVSNQFSFSDSATSARFCCFCTSLRDTTSICVEDPTILRITLSRWRVLIVLSHPNGDSPTTRSVVCSPARNLICSAR